MKETRRYKLGRLLGGITRHLLLLTATPHNGKEEDFQLFLALLDADRLEGRFRDGVHQVDASDLMRRMVKEQLLTFDGKPLFLERRAYTVNYTLSSQEAALYHQVTQYVTAEMHRAARLRREGEGRRGNTVDFALTILQRRPASSPEAIYQSLRRRERLEKRLREEEIGRRGAVATERLRVTALETDPLRTIREGEVPYLSDDEVEELEDAPEGEVELLEERALARDAMDARKLLQIKEDMERAEARRLQPHYIRRYPFREPGFAEVSVNLNCSGHRLIRPGLLAGTYLGSSGDGIRTDRPTG